MSIVVTHQPRPGVMQVTLNRPQKRNALNLELLESLCDQLDAASTDENCRVILLRGNGPTFCAGLDLKELTELEKADASGHLVARCLEALYYSPKITVAAVHGAAVAGGAGLMSACDFVVAARGTKFGYPEVRRGLVAGLVMTFLRRQLRERDARELLLTAELIGSRRALEIGLVTRVVEAEDVDEEINQLLTTVLRNGPKALSLTKELLDAMWSPTVREHVKDALATHMEARSSSEAVEGAQAFLEKREPAWT